MKNLTGIICVSILTSGCGGGGGSNPAAQNASPGGIWRGTDSVTGYPMVGLVTETGEAHFIRNDGVQFVGTVATSGNSISANYEGFTQFGYVFPDGSTHGTGNLSGTVSARSSISASGTFTTDKGESNNATLSLTFDSLYKRASSLATIAGNFLHPASNVISINSNGAIFMQDPNTQCVVNGTVSIINASYNAYRVQYSYANCTGSAATLNGVQFSGLGTLDNTVSPERAIVGVTGQSGSTKLAIVWSLPRT